MVRLTTSSTVFIGVKPFLTLNSHSVVSPQFHLHRHQKTEAWLCLFRITDIFKQDSPQVCIQCLCRHFATFVLIRQKVIQRLRFSPIPTVDVAINCQHKNRSLIENLMAIQIVTKSPAFYGTRCSSLFSKPVLIPIHNLPNHFENNHFSISLLSVSRSSECPLPFEFSCQNVA